MKNSSDTPDTNHQSDSRSLYIQVLKHWQQELVNSDTADEWLVLQGNSSHAIVRKLTNELKQKSEHCHELLRSRLSDLNLGFKEDEAFVAIRKGVPPYGTMGKLEELYSTNSILIGLTEELIAALRNIQDNRTASLLARMRNVQLERHQLYTRFFQPGHITFTFRNQNAGGLIDH